MRQTLEQQIKGMIGRLGDEEARGKLTAAFNTAKASGLLTELNTLRSHSELIGEDYRALRTDKGGLRIDITYESQFRGSFRREAERCLTVEGNEISATTGWSEVKTTGENITPAIDAVKGFRQRLRQSLNGGAR